MYILYLNLWHGALCIWLWRSTRLVRKLCDIRWWQCVACHYWRSKRRLEIDTVALLLQMEAGCWYNLWGRHWLTTHSRPRRTSLSKQAWSHGRECVFLALATEEIISIDSTDSSALSEWSHLHKQRLSFFTKLVPAHDWQPYWNAGLEGRANEQLLRGCSPIMSVAKPLQDHQHRIPAVKF
jgi:hypothetical protein